MGFNLHQKTMSQINSLDPVNSHGWVIPRPDGRRTCAGPQNGCRECILERALYTASERTVVIEGLKANPGDQILLIAPPGADPRAIQEVMEKVHKQLPDVHFTVVAGFTGVQIASS